MQDDTTGNDTTNNSAPCATHDGCVLHVIDTQHPLYPPAVELRYEVLRRPLGIARAAFDLSQDVTNRFVVACAGGAVVGVVALGPTPHHHTAQLRQMAVLPSRQSSGLGRALVAALETHARERGVTTIILHARHHAVGFYAKLGYAAQGDEFLEVGIPHRLMSKQLAARDT